ncbi:hypothetical protein KAFR_0C02280 [Kazachstania africana CBS 2517]|uniref:Ribosomal protein L7/L12 C-terminal domain-containing protein n=1 Tax=Kazachstania africana (strain ATCC 22294 / BCRC 22015 / CBS 2517 / CECT 1963 / NBRC 1671 / NRRL Y-8276) TaxID=1071382 RepID=H2AS71_KAZAF|nr:hypothetical protein KAFR_0C02280 [Kazachstania africana CBS 2517]CCF57221.1 hypothetical protein KAFR_0C02280 [Kazachstania africana CBS 2517]
MLRLGTLRATQMIARPVMSSVRCLTRYNSTVSNEKLESIVDSISKLNILETSNLVTLLKERLNIPDINMGAPMMMSNVNTATDTNETKETSAAEEEKTTFTIKLESFDAKSKAKIIKEIKSLLGLSLVDAKKFVESAPKVIKDNISKDDASSIKDTLEKLGGKISME